MGNLNKFPRLGAREEFCDAVVGDILFAHPEESERQLSVPGSHPDIPSGQAVHQSMKLVELVVLIVPRDGAGQEFPERIFQRKVHRSGV